ncbi:porin [Robertkochia sediminum]|uniref:porin n=1 Tax=Robertkochia sediminum TaxID=2785326 RepID=UPI001F43E5C3|nr:porin [Robertkochia sediminum]MBL7471863.1 porin [Robertkochia sediminum]
MRHFAIAVMMLLMTSAAVQAQEVTAPKFGKGLLNIVGQDSTWSMNFSARVQLLSSTVWTDNEGTFQDPRTNTLIRRSRLKFKGHLYSPKITYKMEFGLSNRDMGGVSPFTNNTPRFIMDAVIKYNFYENFELWAGQTKLPGNIERVISSGDLQLVDRSIVNSRFNIDRDMGIQLRHHITLGEKFLIREKLALSQGEGRNVTTGNLGGQQYTGRIELLPFGKFSGKGDYKGAALDRQTTPKLMLSATYDMNKNAVRTRSNMGRYMATDYGFHETDINTFFADMMFKYKGFSFMGEYAKRDADTPVATNLDGTPTGDVVWVGDGLNLMSGYLFKNNIEITGRYATTNIDETLTGVGKEEQYTLGVSKYFVGHKLKLQSDVSYIDFIDNNDRIMWRLQLDFHF